MSDCCASAPVNLGCIGFCDIIETGITAPSTGTYIISLVGSGGYASYDFTLGEEISFTNPFNEDSVAIFQILRNGSVIENTDCFEVSIKASISLT